MPTRPIRLLHLFLLLLSSSLLSQTDYRIIGLQGQVQDSISADFFVQGIEDRRSFQSNFGIVNRGSNRSKKRALMPKVGFFDQVKQLMNGWISPKQGAQPVVAQVEELYIWENLQLRAGEGGLRLKVAFLEPESGEETPVTVEMFGEKTRVPEGHAPRLEKAFFKSLQHFAAGQPAVSREAAVPTARQGAVLAAASFLDLWAGRLQPVQARLEPCSVAGLHRYKLQTEGCRAYYALVREGEWFIKANTYFGKGQHYSKVLEKGRYLFLIDERPSSLLVELGLSKTKNPLGVVIDMQTGVPKIVDDAFMQQLMAPYPDLQQQYLFDRIQEYPVQLNRVRNVIAEVNRREENS